jgi:hypothetical protein
MNHHACPSAGRDGFSTLWITVALVNMFDAVTCAGLRARRAARRDFNPQNVG